MTTPTTDAHPRHVDQSPPGRRIWWGLALLCLAQFMLVLDVTVVNVALPDIGTDLGLHRAALTWVLTTYTVAFGGLMLLGGRLADLYGARRMLLIGLAVFTGASLASGLARDASVLLAGRGVQGIGAALLSPAALSLLTATFTGTRRGRALGIWAAIGGAGAALGVILGGVLTSTVGWEWIFFINVPVGVLVLLALPVTLPPVPAGGYRGRLDLLGALTVTAGTGAAIYGLTNAGTHGWLATGTLLPLVGALALYALFVLWQRTVAAPLVDLRLLARRPMAVGSLLMLVTTGLLVGSFFLGSFFLQRAQNYSALRTGLLFLPVAVADQAGRPGRQPPRPPGRLAGAGRAPGWR